MHRAHRTSRTFTPRRRLQAGCGSTALCVLLLLPATPLRAQALPPSLGDRVAELLALGDADGCVDFLRISDAEIQEAGDRQAAVNNALNALEAAGDIGDGLHAICGPSAVGSASALGGALDSAQATKTVSQFRLVRRRIDRRLPPRRPRPVQESPLMLFLQPAVPVRDPALGQAVQDGVAVFGEVEYERQDREATRLLDGYEADLRAGLIGIDYGWNRTVLGAWGGYRRMDGDLTSGFAPFLDDPAQQAAACGGVSPGGDFDLDGGSLGVFAGWKLGDSGFVDLNAARSRRDYRYTRNTCVIEITATPVSFVNGGLVGGPPDSPQPIDDIYAGYISGDTDVTESGLSLRAGFDRSRGAWTFGPRATLAYTRTSIDAYAETGWSTVANQVEPNNPAPLGDPPGPGQGRIITRAIGDGIGLELAYREQRHDSLLLEVGGVVERRFEHARGQLVAHASAYWRHEFRDDLRYATASFVQDLRPDPVVFAFANGEVDADTAVFTLGLTAVFNARAAMRLELSHLAFDRHLDATGISAQVRVGL